MGFRGGFRFAAVAGADIFQRRLIADNDAGDGEVFNLPSPSHRWRVYQLHYSLGLLIEGHATAQVHKAASLYLSDAPELLPRAWQTQLPALVAATDRFSATDSGVGLDLPGGLLFPTGDDIMLILELVTITSVFGFNQPVNSSYVANVVMVAKAELP